MDWKEKYKLYKEDTENLHLVDLKQGDVFIIYDYLDAIINYLKETYGNEDLKEAKINEIEIKEDILKFFEDYIYNNSSSYESYELEGFLFNNYLKDKLIETDLNELKQDIIYKV